MRPVDRGVGDVGRGAQVLVAVRFVDEQVVDAGGLEGDAGVLGGVELRLEAFLGAQQRAFQPLDAQPVAFLGCLDEVPHPVHFGAQVLALGVGAHRDPLERRPGHDDGVPVAGRAAGDELAAPVGLEVFALGDQDFGLGVELEELAAELLQHVVGDHDAGLVDQLEAAQFHRAHGHLGGFPGADLVEQPDGGLVDDPGDGGDLVRAGLEAQRQAGQRQRRVVVGAQDDVVEQPVVDGGELLGAGRVFPGPFAEPLGQLGGFFLGGEGLVHVQDPGLVRRSCRGPRCGAAPGSPGPGPGRGSGWCPRWRWPAPCPGCRGRSRPARRDARPARRGRRGSRRGSPGRGRRRSRRRPAGRRSRSASGRRDDLAQFLGVDVVAGVVGGGPLGGLAACRGPCRTGTPRPGSAGRSRGRRRRGCPARGGPGPRRCPAAGRWHPAGPRRGRPGRSPARRRRCQRRGGGCGGR